MSPAKTARKPRKVDVPPTPASVEPIAAPPHLKAVRDALNEIDLRVTRIRVVARTLDEDFFETVATARPKDEQFSEIFLVYCDSLKHAAADIGERTERAFAALAWKVGAA
jgi:hypothetical protein